MPIKSSSTHLIKSNYFEVKNEITIKSAELITKAKSTYDIVLKKKQNEKYDIEINRFKFLVNGGEVENKFPLVSHLYFQSIFPLQFFIENETLKLSNYKEIQNRIAKIDNIIIDKYKGEGIHYIRTAFLKQFEEVEIANDFIIGLNFISIINLTLKRHVKEDHFYFKWKIPSVGVTFWKLKMEDKKKDSVSYSSNDVDKSEFLKALNEYRTQNNYNNLQEEELNVESSFLAAIQFESNSLNIVEANTNCRIKFGKHFDYQENISIKSVL
ncbi:hypothetical protein FIA58_020925 [Flavobacterium jejuense]|uniref:Uncharacterized protein n=1 Tax=Flavobacterium jejuense TaxID=1544455 RepID=A0ABX0J2D8_9FLAO|nr:hypothetical protein [Flavobacterium jejuense]NHN28149.1 hypothetical protein [Flavobacterium jejuense]